MQTLAEAITASFYAWELRGRGWLLADYPVSLEPPHRPLLLLPGSAYGSAPVDDGKRPTFFSALIDQAKGLFEETEKPKEIEETFEEDPLFPAQPRSPLSALSIRTPVDFKADNEIALRLVNALSVASRPVSFELIGRGGRVTLQIVCAEDDARHVVDSITGFAPLVGVVPIDDQLAIAFDNASESLVVDFGLRHEFFLPLRVVEPSHADPYIPLMGALAQAGRDETVCLQILFEHVRNAWGRTILHAVTDEDGSSRFADAPEFVSLARAKTGSPMLAVVTRLAVSAGSPARRAELSRATAAFFLQFTRSDGNSLIPLENDEYDERLHQESILTRESYRSGMLLSAEELVGLVHLPDVSLAHSALLREHHHTRPLPLVAKGHELVLGVNEHQGVSLPVTVATEARLAHMHVIGATGTGKSTLLLNLIVQDIAQGNGLAVFDPHGDLVEEILSRIPGSRGDDVILFDPSDEDFPVGFGLFTASSEIERNLIASDTVAAFQRLSSAWGDTMTAVLGNAVYAMLAHPDVATLLDLRRFLIDVDFRTVFLARITDQEIHFFWEHEYPLIGTRSLGPILTRLDAFLRPRLIRNIVGQREPRLDLAKAVAERKIILAKLSQGLIGEENASLLGSLLVTKLHQTALARQRLASDARTPFFCYLDEFQHFVTPSIASLMSEGRKYHMGLVLAHQSLAQLADSKVESAVLGNAYTRVVFRVGDADAKRLAEGFAHFEGTDLQSQGRGEAIIRLGGAANDCNVRGFPPVQREAAATDPEMIRARSREQYGRPKEVVEQETAPPVVEPRPAKQTRNKVEPLPEEEPPPELETKREDDREPVPPRVPKRSVPTPKVPKDLGKGGEEHKYLQYLVKRLAEERGFRAVIEEDIGEGRSVDVLLRREGVTVACEISVTTEIDHELANVLKCSALGYSRILFISGNKRKRDQLARRATDAVPGIPLVALAPEEIVAVLDEIDVPPAAEQTVRGYKVKVKRQQLSYQDLASRRGAVAEVIARSLLGKKQ